VLSRTSPPARPTCRSTPCSRPRGRGVLLATSAAGAAAAVAAAVATKIRQGPDLADSHPLVLTGRASRGAGLACLAGRVGRSYAKSRARQVFAAFNGDPQPGNYLFHSGGRVTILDFGLVKWFTGPEVQLLAAMVKALVVPRDTHAFRQAAELAGFLRPEPTLTDEDVANFFGQYYEPILAGGRTAFSSEYVTATLRTFFDARNDVVKRANVPAPFVLVQRINLGLYSVLAGLDATADWRRIAEEVWPFVDAAPSTELGAKEAIWRANQGCMLADR
jgi:predicted unusual protein kinase regulating ubiquinone biosynthesis (AarF/ABC1/UbiB family)